MAGDPAPPFPHFHMTPVDDFMNSSIQTAYMSRLLRHVAEKGRRLEDDFQMERTEDGDEEIVGKRYVGPNEFTM